MEYSNKSVSSEEQKLDEANYQETENRNSAEFGAKNFVVKNRR